MKGWVQQTPGVLEHSETIIHNFKYLKERDELVREQQEVHWKQRTEDPILE